MKDVSAGTCGGIAQVLAGQPFDTTKVRLQCAPPGKYSGALDVVQQLLKNEGILGFYKGTLTPLVGIGACVSIQFGVNEFMKRFFRTQNVSKGLGENTSLSSLQFYLCGGASGFANGFLAAPIEHIRIRLQTQTSANGLYNGPIDCIRKIHQQSGFATGVMRGLGPTLIRESHGIGIYFMTFEALVKYDTSRNQIDRKEIPGLRLCLYGAAAGYSMWFTSYPIDVIKTKMQTDDLSNKVYKSMLDCASKTYKAGGIKPFFNGFLPTILRAGPVNAVTFYAFELAMRALG
ncbi:mitochondrial carrier [Ascoidea rubescens DSM 1968]|uniref:Mitochondrial carrier n=1 Tax=Ascoidea rubescens DSM 1968 TaxID=1344418 RepID=A0A1D2VQH3_9ASCO|nr:mitochondrial carrier [Ascoidea rubescens DSM 1968]ODV63838.1 mitochondrial carrier [Ascoidea rubescens DSM 1968]